VKRFSIVAVVTLCGFAVAVACADPYEGEIPNTEAPVRDAASAEDATSDASVEPAGDAVADVQADVDPCSDRDKDGFVDRACDGGTDCDDDDRRANPSAGFVRELPTLVTGGDWNCNGSTTFEQPTNVSCSAHTSDSLGNGCALQGFKANPGCGKTGDFVKCKSSGLLAPCAEESVVQLVQGCK
jgi:hypothetical protein